MIIKDTIFGELEYDYVWSRIINMDFFGNKTSVDLLIKGEEDGEFEEGQYTAYQSLLRNWGDIQQVLLDHILTYYNRKRRDLGYDIEVNEVYPMVETTDQILKMISLDSIVVPYADIFETRHIGITFNCTWDTENGLGIRLLDERVAEVGYQDVAI